MVSTVSIFAKMTIGVNFHLKPITQELDGKVCAECDEGEPLLDSRT